MSIDFLIAVVNTGLFILIWLVQIIIYPSFYYYQENDLKRWHGIYTRKITYIVMPLMLGQLGLYTWISFTRANWADWISLGLIGIIWGITFLISIPWHHRIDHHDDTIRDRQQLVRSNWIRTVLWTIIFIISIYQYAK